MTQEEPDALPEDGTFTWTEEVRDGRLVKVPRLVTVGALWAEKDETSAVIDAAGNRWRVGWANGVRYKRRVRG